MVFVDNTTLALLLQFLFALVFPVYVICWATGENCSSEDALRQRPSHQSTPHITLREWVVWLPFCLRCFYSDKSCVPISSLAISSRRRSRRSLLSSSSLLLNWLLVCLDAIWYFLRNFHTLFFLSINVFILTKVVGIFRMSCSCEGAVRYDVSQLSENGVNLFVGKEHT